MAALMDLLAGRWRLDRRVSTGISMHGTADFIRRTPDVLFYHEEGRSDLAEFTRDFCYLFEGPDLKIFYADGPDSGKLFLTFPGLNETALPASAAASHLCGADVYDAAFTFSGGVFTTDFTVRGPNKDYSIATRYEKITAA